MCGAAPPNRHPAGSRPGPGSFPAWVFRPRPADRERSAPGRPSVHPARARCSRSAAKWGRSSVPAASSGADARWAPASSRWVSAYWWAWASGWATRTATARPRATRRRRGRRRRRRRGGQLPDELAARGGAGGGAHVVHLDGEPERPGRGRPRVPAGDHAGSEVTEVTRPGRNGRVRDPAGAVPQVAPRADLDADGEVLREAPRDAGGRQHDGVRAGGAGRADAHTPGLGVPGREHGAVEQRSAAGVVEERDAARRGGGRHRGDRGDEGAGQAHEGSHQRPAAVAGPRAHAFQRTSRRSPPFTGLSAREGRS